MADLLRWGGCTVGEETAFMLQKSLNDLSAQLKSKGNDGASIRLAARVLGSSRDYWVAEVSGVAGEDVEGREPRGAQTSANR